MLCSWIADSVFGYVLDCSKEQENSIILDPVLIGKLARDRTHCHPTLVVVRSRTVQGVPNLCAGTQGPFAVNLWFKSNITDNSGDLFAYLLSALTNATQAVSGGNNVYVPNSLQLILPEVCQILISVARPECLNVMCEVLHLREAKCIPADAHVGTPETTDMYLQMCRLPTTDLGL